MKNKKRSVLEQVKAYQQCHVDYKAAHVKNTIEIQESIAKHGIEEGLKKIKGK